LHRIVMKRKIAPVVHIMEVEVRPQVAAKVLPGQFIVLRIDERGERIPLTPVTADKEKGTLTVIFQEVGVSTKRLGSLKEGDSVSDVVGPLGKPMEIKGYGTVVVVAGGVGIACIYPEARALKGAGNKVIGILGARNAELLILEQEMREISDELYVMTDDGTKGRKGLVTDVLKEIIERGERIDLVLAVGPTIMMKVVADVTREHDIKTVSSLNPIMVDATGMCGGCRVIVGGETKFTCVDGPSFDAHLVDFDNLLLRLKMYSDEEKVAVQLYEKMAGDSSG
jgi:ferredoxin--NADP+ reductase